MVDPSMMEALKYLQIEAEDKVTCQLISNVILGSADLQNKPNYDVDAN